MLLTAGTHAYINCGRWVADCPRPHCGGAEKLAPRQAAIHCTHCLLVTEVHWPPDPDGITEVLDARPVPHTRNWAPADHRQAIACGVPSGQSIADLIAESREHGVG